MALTTTTEWIMSSYDGPTPSPTVWTLSGMTAETIQIREKIFITTHWVISFLILAIIPVIYFMNKCEKRKRDEKNLSKQIEEDTNNKTETGNNKTDTQPENSVNSVNSANSATSPDSKSVASVNSTSNSKSRSKRYGSAADVQKAKINRIFKILAAICVFIWWSRAVTAACSLMIWHYDYLTAIDIAFGWDTFRMMLYHTSKLLMYLTYMTRIYFAFNKSAYGYPRWFIIGMYTLICSDFIMKLASYIMLNEISSGAVQDKEEASDFLNGAFIFLVIEECIVTTSITVAFLLPLCRMSKYVIKEKILEVMVKYSILGLLSILSSVALSLFRLTYVGSFDLMVIWMTAIWVSIDCLINSWCTVLLFGDAKPTYNLFCGLVDKKIRQIIVNNYKKNNKDKPKVELGDI